MFSQSKETLDHETSELAEWLGSLTSEHLNVLPSKLECDSLEVQITRTVAKQESKVYMHHVTLTVEHDVTIVSILDLEYVTKQRIASHTLQESILCLSILLPVYLITLYTISLYEILPQTCEMGISFLKLIDWHSIWYSLNQPTISTGGYNIEWFKP